MERRFDPKGLVQGAADQWAVVAAHAVHAHEGLQAALLLFVQCRCIATQEIIETRLAAQGALERGDGLAQVGVTERRFCVGKCRLECRGVLRQCGQFVDHRLFVRHTHFDRIEDRLARLVGQVLGAAIPELRFLPTGVDHRWRVARAYLTLGTG